MMNQKKSLVAHVCLVPMSPKELPSNALKQHKDYVRKRNYSSVHEVNKARNSLWTSESSFLGEHCHASTAITSVTSDDYTNGLGMLAKDILTNDGLVSDNLRQVSPMDFSFLSEVNHCNTEADYSKPAGRRNSVVSSSVCELAHTSPGKRVGTPLHLSPIICNKSGYNGTPLHLECNETMSHLMNDSPSSGSDRANTGNVSYFLRSNLKQKEYEEMSVISIVSGQSDSEQLSGESIFPSSVVSCDDNATSGCEHLSLDLSSYSPPSSPVSAGNESIICSNFPLKINVENEKHLSGESPKPEHSKSGLLSPKVKVVPLHDELVAPNKKMRSLSDGIVFERKSSNSLGNLVVKVEDIRAKLKPCGGGGFTLPARGRLTNSGLKAVNNYSEKSFVNAYVTRASLATPKVKKRKARCKVQHSSTRKGKKARLQLRNSGGLKNKAIVKYENLKFSELNTVSRMSVRYRVAFQKWGFVFSGALDLINQRLANQNAFWDSLGSSG